MHVCDLTIGGSRQPQSGFFHNSHATCGPSAHPVALLTGVTKGLPCVIMSIIMYVKDPQLSVLRVGHCASLAGFCLSLYQVYVEQGCNQSISQASKQSSNQVIKLAFFRD